MNQANDDECNLIMAVMYFKRLPLQPAIREAEIEIKKLRDTFLTLERRLLEADPPEHPRAAEYVQGIRDWIIGFAYWIYETDLYFGELREQVKEFGWVFTWPKGYIQQQILEGFRFPADEEPGQQDGSDGSSRDGDFDESSDDDELPELEDSDDDGDDEYDDDDGGDDDEVAAEIYDDEYEYAVRV